MIVKSNKVQMTELADQAFQVMTQVLLSLPRGKREIPSKLKEMEFFTLAILQQHETMIVGDIQRILGVLPAQMSRIIRALADRNRPLIKREFNPKDNRKINITLTNAGEKALNEHVSPRVDAIQELLVSKLSESERKSLAELLNRFEQLIGEESFDDE